MKRYIALILSLVMLVAAFAGCGEEKKPSENNGGNTSDKTDPTQEETRTFDTPEQEALVVTAEAYLARGEYMQYADTRLVSNDVATVYRTDRFYYTPEDSTRQFTGYSNCAAWTYEVYYRALGIDIKYWYTSALQKATELHVLTKELTGKETPEEKKALREELLGILQVGDLVCVRNEKNASAYGHVMMYVGDDSLIHSTSSYGGGNYDYTGNKEKWEENGCVVRSHIDILFSPIGQNLAGHSCYSVIRPLIDPEHKANAKVTEQAQNRIDNLQNIVVEKCSSHPAGYTAAPGEEITYTFYLRNDRKTDATVELIDNVPTNATYVSGAEKVDGSKLSWNVKLPAGQTTEVKYTVKVNADAKTGAEVYGEGTVGGVTVRCRPIYVGKALDTAARSKINASGAKGATFGGADMELAQKIYTDAGINTTLPTAQALLDSLIPESNGSFSLNTESEYFKMLVPTMYGGYKCLTSDAFNNWRTKGPYMCQLMEGDILVTSENNIYKTYMYIGDGCVLSMASGKVEILEDIAAADALMTSIGCDRFAVIRPAMAK